MASYLVTGAAGFVGANLLRRLVGKGEIVATIHPKDQPWRLKGLSAKVKFLKLDLSNFEAVQQVVRKAKPDCIFHLAAYGTYPTQKDFRPIFNANTLGTANLLEALNPLNYKAFVMTGSSSEYGYQEKPMSESDVLEPNSLYSATKGAASLIAQGFAAVENKPVVVLRFFSIYGPWEEPGRFIPTAIARCIKGKPVEVTGGKQVRDFVYVDDAINALLKAAQKAQRLKGQIFNVGSGKQTKIIDMAKKIIRVTSSNSSLRVGAYQARPWDASNWLADTRKSKQLLGWRVETNIEQGIGQTFRWFKDNLEHYQ